MSATRCAQQQTTTISGELVDAFRGLDADLLLITDEHGRVVTGVGKLAGPPAGTSLRSLPALHSALFGQSTAADSAFGVLNLHGVPLEIAAVPVLVHGFPVGALVLGKRIDRILPADSCLRPRQVVASDALVLASSLEGAPAGSAWQPRWSRVDSTSATLVIGGEEYVAATLPLGLGQEGRPVNLYLLRSLNAAIVPIERALTRRFLVAGLLAVVLAGAGGAVLSRTTLLPLSRFVTFMESGTRD